MSLLLLLIIVLVLVGGVPAYSSGTLQPMLGTILGIVLLLLILGALFPYYPHHWMY